MKRTNAARNSSTRRAKFLQALQYHGLCARVARVCDVDRSHVLRVIRGERTSKRIEAAVEAEIARIERGESAA